MRQHQLVWPDRPYRTVNVVHTLSLCVTKCVWGAAAGYPAGVGGLGTGANITIAHISKYSNVVSRHISVSIWHS